MVSPQIAQSTIKTAQKVHRDESRPPKTAAAYWLSKVRKPTGCTHYGVQLAYRSERHRFSLDTADKKLASERARDRFLYVAAHGWKQTLEHFKPEAHTRPRTSVGDLIDAASRLSSARVESLTTYAQALRRLTSGVLELRQTNDGKRKRASLSAEEWRERVDATPLEKLTPSAVLAWKNVFLRAAKSPERRNSAAVTFNAILRNSKALLSKKLRPFLEREIVLPSPLWFEGVGREKEPSLRYHSRIDAAKILEAAQNELAETQPDVFKALLLTLVCGLRRSEADKLLWRQFDFDAKTLHITDTEAKALKSADSAGVLGLDDELVAILKRMHDSAGGPYVIEETKRKRSAPRRVYRCDVHFETLIHWLKSKGVPGLRPIHVLRKEIGSVIATREGIFAASRYLRHSNIAITSKLYADSKKPIRAGLGTLLTTSPVP